MPKRIFDIVLSLTGILILSPFFLIISAVILFDSGGTVFFRQIRVGLNGKDFFLLKFRTMHSGAEQMGQITIGEKDSRITRIGYYLRKVKLDELPQLLNVLAGEMSLVGPRPEVRKYVNGYTKEQLQVLSVKPGITDYASIAYSNENELLGKAENPEEYYINEILPAKLKLNLKYIEKNGVLTDLGILAKTLRKIISKK